MPDATAPGGPQFTLTVNGTGFVSKSVVNWNGGALTTQFVSGSQLTATVPAAEIAAATLITRDDFGKATLNTSYLLRMLTSVAKDTASTPYWRRRFADPVSDLGSTIGNDVGMNVLHEFEPGIENLLKNHTPKFVTAMEEHRVRAEQR